MQPPARTVDATAVDAFRRHFTGDVVLPDDPRYDEARVVWNGAIDRYPAIVVRPRTAEDIAQAVRFARDRELLLAVRGGGHSIPGLSTCDDGIVIDLSPIRGVEVDPDRRVARVLGGSLLGELDEAAQRYDLVCPVGVVSHTGVAGLTLGGGMGHLQRKHGLTIDNLRSVELVTADGRLVRADAEENEELFWGLRGAGANFGIAVAFSFDLHPLAWPLTFGALTYPIDRAHDLAEVLVQLEETGPDELMLTYGVARAIPEEDFPSEVAGRPIALLGVAHAGPPDAAAADLAPLRTLGPPIRDTIAARSYLAIQHASDEELRWGRRYYTKSGFLSALSPAVVDRFVHRIADAPRSGAGALSVWSWGRAVSRVPEEATAFTGRGARFWVGVDVVWDEASGDDEHIAWGRSAMADLLPFTTEGRYVNDVAESGEDVILSVYGEAKYERLVALKRVWDPENVFRLNQNIRPA